VIPDESFERLAGASIAHLATVRQDGTPHIVRCRFACHGDTIFAVLEPPGDSGATTEAIGHQSLVSVMTGADATDEKRWWVRADGHARVIEDADDAARLRQYLIEKYHAPQGEGLEGALITVEIREWRFWPE